MKSESIYRKRSSFFLLMSIVSIFFSCQEDNLSPKFNPKEGINILIGDEYLIASEDIDFYDNSSHLFYLKNSLNQDFAKLNNSKFWILSDGNVIYEGLFVSMIGNPCNGDSTLEFKCGGDAKFVLQLGSMYSSKTYDTTWISPQTDKKFIDELTRQGIFHRGLECKIDSLILSESKEIMLYYSITNYDTENYYMLDPQKTPVDNIYSIEWELTLFQAEPTVYDIPDGKDYVYQFNGVPNPPFSNISYKNGWNLEWLTLIEKGETKSFSKKFYLLIEHPIPQEEFWVHIMIPGLGCEFNEPEEVVLNDGRIWLGYLEMLTKARLQ